MLVLTRQVGQSIIIDGNIKVTIIKLNGNQVAVGIDAPREVSVHREEIQDRVNKGIPKGK